MPALGLKLRLDRITYALSTVTTAGMQLWHKMTASAWSGSNRMPDSSAVGTNTGALNTGRGLDFDGVNDYVDMGNPAVTCKTIVFYCNPDTTTQSILQLTAIISVSIVAGVLTATGWTSPTRYVNGAASSTVAATSWQQIAITSATGFTVNDLELGRIMAVYFSGMLSNVKIFGIELSAGQVAELYANPEQALPTGAGVGDLVGWWEMVEGNAPGSISDSSSARNGGLVSGATNVTAIGSGVSQISMKGQNNKMSFDGVNDYVALSAISAPSVFSYSCWISPETFTGNTGRFLSLGYNLTQFSSSTSILFFPDLDLTEVTFTVPAIVFGRMYHIVITHNGTSTVKIYINGSLAATETGVAMKTNSTAGSIGKYSLNADFHKGIIWEVGYFNSVLTSAEVTTLYNSGTPLTLLSNSGNYVSAANLVGYWVNKGTSNGDWADLRGSNNGTVNGSPVVFNLSEGMTAGKDGLGYSILKSNNGEFILNGDGYEVATDAASLDITSAITLEAWVKPSQVTAAQTIIGKTGSYALGVTSAGKPVFTKWTSTAPTATATTSTALALNTWALVAATYDGANVKIYINGALNTTTAVTGAMDATSADVLIGALTSSTELFSGYIDSVKIYNTALADTAVLGNYNAESAEHS